MSEFIELFKKLKDPSFTLSELPKKLYVPSKTKSSGLFRQENLFWKKIKLIRQYTDSGSKNFKKEHTGSTGWEYEMIMAYIYDSYFYSDIHTSKEYEKVQNSHKIEIKTEQIENKVLDKVYIDSHYEGEISWEQSELSIRNLAIEQGKYSLNFISHFHSHPISIYNQKQIYTFYSIQDIDSLFSSIPISGLITDRLFLLCKLENSTKPTQSELQKITNSEYYEPENFLKIAWEVCSNHNLGLYASDGFAGDLNLI